MTVSPQSTVQRVELSWSARIYSKYWHRVKNSSLSKTWKISTERQKLSCHMIAGLASTKKVECVAGCDKSQKSYLTKLVNAATMIQIIRCTIWDSSRIWKYLKCSFMTIFRWGKGRFQIGGKSRCSWSCLNCRVADLIRRLLINSRMRWMSLLLRMMGMH